MVLFSFMAIVQVNFCSQSQIGNYEIMYESICYFTLYLQFSWKYNSSHLETLRGKLWVGCWSCVMVSKSSGLFLDVTWLQRLLLSIYHSLGPKLVVIKGYRRLDLLSCFMDTTSLKTISSFSCYIVIYYNGCTALHRNAENKI